MNTGRCTGCNRWRIALRIYTCRCLTGPTHRPGYTCPHRQPTDWFCRDHQPCGPRQPALHVTDIGNIPRRKTT